MRLLTALVIGMIFGTGIAVSGMANPAKVLNFFDVAGTWDPSLALVMASALATTAIGYRIVFSRRNAPLFDTSYAIPTVTRIDARLLVGSAIFGVGWGMTGFCPGGAIPAIGLGHPQTFVFVVAMVAGIVIARVLQTTVMKAKTL